MEKISEYVLSAGAELALKMNEHKDTVESLSEKTGLAVSELVAFLSDRLWPSEHILVSLSKSGYFGVSFLDSYLEWKIKSRSNRVRVIMSSDVLSSEAMEELVDRFENDVFAFFCTYEDTLNYQKVFDVLEQLDSLVSDSALFSSEHIKSITKQYVRLLNALSVLKHSCLDEGLKQRLFKIHERIILSSSSYDLDMVRDILKSILKTIYRLTDNIEGVLLSIEEENEVAR